MERFRTNCQSILFLVSDDTKKELRRIVKEGQEKRQSIFEKARSLAESLMTIRKIIPAKDYIGKVPNGTDLVLTTIEFADSGMINKKRNKGAKNIDHSANRSSTK